MERVSKTHSRPLSPNIQIYRPQLTSVLSIANRITGVVLSVSAISLVVWLVATANGPQTYSRFQDFLGSWPVQILLWTAIFAFFLHLCGGIRHLVWDTVRGFELREIYASGWAVTITSIFLTFVTWLLSQMIGSAT